jgi:hypothetical protein
MSADDLWKKLDALPWPAPWTATTFEIECPCPNGADCGDDHTCDEVAALEAYPWSPGRPAKEGSGQCVVQISTPGIECFSRPCAEFIASARNELPAIREYIVGLEEERAKAEATIAELRAKLVEIAEQEEANADWEMQRGTLLAAGAHRDTAEEILELLARTEGKL